MFTNFRNRSLIAAVLTLAMARIASAQGDVGTRAAGMAGAFVAVADDATAVYWNPAGVGTGSLVSLVLDAGRFRLGSASQAVPNEDTGAIVALSATAFGLAYYRLGTYGISTAEPAGMSPQSREEVLRSVHALTTSTVGVAFVQSLGEHIVVGVTPKLVHGDGELAGDVDAGLMAWVDRFRFGLVARNLTTPAFADATAGKPGDGEEIELQREVRIGGAWGSGWTGISRVVVSVDGDVMSRATPAGDRRDIAAGLETWWMSQRIGLRGGVRRSTIGEARAAVAAGISAGLKPGMLVEAHVLRGRDEERSWSVGARMTF
jgi:hypothetical protein